MKLGDTTWNSGVTFSPCGQYRYSLWRLWGDGPAGVWILLNPSTADAYRNDATVERCSRRARTWGWGGLYILNLFALRSTDPRAIYSHPDPIGPENNAHLLASATAAPAGHVICGWGAHGSHMGRGVEVVLGLRAAGVTLRCLKMTKSGHPAHPLYLPYDLWPQPYQEAA